MRLGILVNSNDCLQVIVGLTKAAAAKNHVVEIFAMDTGTRLLEEPSYVALADLGGVSMSYCEHSAKELAVKTAAVTDKIESSSQYNNAAMTHNADKVIVL